MTYWRVQSLGALCISAWLRCSEPCHFDTWAGMIGHSAERKRNVQARDGNKQS